MNKIKKIGLVVSQLSANQLSYQLIHSTNKLLSQRDDTDVSLFWINDGHRPVKPNFACMPLFECFAYTGITIATSIHTASRILTYPGPNRHPWLYWYCYDLDWLRLPAQQRQFESLATLYNHPKIRLIARSEEHAEILTSVWKPPIGVVPDCNVELLAGLAE